MVQSGVHLQAQPTALLCSAHPCALVVFVLDQAAHALPSPTQAVVAAQRSGAGSMAHMAEQHTQVGMQNVCRTPRSAPMLWAHRSCIDLAMLLA